MDEKDALQQQLELLQRQLHTQQEVIQKQEQQLQERQRQLNDSMQQHPGDASATLAAPAGSAEVVRTPADDILHVAPHDVWRVAVKLPPFRADSPEVCFAHLDAGYANEVRDILANPPTANLYEHLKTLLIRSLSLSEDQKVRQLQSEELAERKPSQLLRHMRPLAGNMEVMDSLLRVLWLQRLPPHVQAILQAQVTLPVDQLAGIADLFAGVGLFATTAAKVSLPQLSPTVQAVAATPNITELARRIDDINRQLRSTQQRLDQHLLTRHSPSRGCNTAPPPPPSQQPGDDDRCYYH
ncbi:hypothetical protein HPB49_016640 [Dermacentor silvarum]|uniref:Uncharacterized protein n=1 Tax=Dermacentor silvarum TaxID=543639 RepID=A0ACB8CG75_DERSI|nr:hypothetical protein HPB49_016640 [Dermacentor silvarum]